MKLLVIGLLPTLAICRSGGNASCLSRTSSNEGNAEGDQVNLRMITGHNQRAGEIAVTQGQMMAINF